MELIAEIERTSGAKKVGRTVLREAVRAIILEGHRLLMVYSPVNGDYKFPGGGIEPGESHEQALAREVQEECGAALAGIQKALGQVHEYDFAQEPEFEIFHMISSYFVCQVQAGQAELRLDDYEAELAFQPAWVDIDEAVQTNRRVLSQSQAVPLWTRRDTLVLEYIRETLIPRPLLPRAGEGEGRDLS